MALRFNVFLLEMKGIVSAVLDSFACMILHNCISYRFIQSFWRKTRHESFVLLGLPLWLKQYRICLQCRRPKFDLLVGRSPGEGNGNPLQYYCLENSMERGVWQAAVHGVAKGQTQLRNQQFSLFVLLCVKTSDKITYIQEKKKTSFTIVEGY